MSVDAIPLPGENADANFAAEVLSHFPAVPRDARVRLVRPGFSGAIVARVDCLTDTNHRRAVSAASGSARSGDDFCLRGWPPDSLPEKRILGLHRLLRHVHEVGVGVVPVPLAARDGSTLLFLHGRYWQLEPWMPGTADYREHPSDERLESAMRALADWHRAAASFEPQPEEAAWFASNSGKPSPAVEERFERIARFQRQARRGLEARIAQSDSPEFRDVALRVLELFYRAAPHVANRLAAARGSRFALQPCLRDVWHDHVLFTNDEVTGLIDASACRSENVATDLARLLGSLVGDDATAWDRALAAYQRHRPLTAQELLLVHLLDGSTVLLAGMVWLERFRLDPEGVSSDERVIGRMRKILSRLEHLAGGVRSNRLAP